MTFNMWIATGAWCCLVVGLLLRNNRTIHARLMLTGITVDITFVLYLQFTRSAIQKAIGPGLEILHRLHIVSSTLALVLYFPVLYYGFKMLKNGTTPELLAKHKRVAIPALILRTLGFGLMFSLFH